MAKLVLSAKTWSSHLVLMQTNVNDLYRAYFKHQAIHHPALQHQEDSRVFGTIDIEESFGDFRQGIKEKSFLFRLINYTYQVGMTQHNLLKFFQGGFLIAKYFSNRKDGEEGYHAAMVAAERLTDEIIEKMISDSRAGHPLWYRSLDSKQDISVQPILFAAGNYCGYRAMFSWHSPFRNCVTDTQAPAWLDGGSTPHELI